MPLAEKHQPETAPDRNVEGAGTPPASEVINDRVGAPVLVAPAENRRLIPVPTKLARDVTYIICQLRLMQVIWVVCL